MIESDAVSVSSQISSTSSQRPKKYKCDWEGCLNAYSKPSLLEQHKRTHTGVRPFKCDYPGCEKSFLRKSHLQVHYISHTNEEAKPFHCAICNKGVNTMQHLKRHERTHEKTFKCDKCHESFYKKQTLTHHKLSVHEKTLTCLVCDKTFARPYRLAQHNEKYHGESPAYQCDHPGCFSNFKTWSALRLHVKTVHPKLECKICHKKCVGVKGLSSHMLSHDDTKMVKVWNCNYCDVGKFAKKLDLLDHYNKFHDGNIPEELLKPNERVQLQNLLNGNDQLNLLNEKLLHQNDDDDAFGDRLTDISADIPRSHRSIEHFEKSLKGSTSIIGLLLDNYSSKRINCPKPNCQRYFSRNHDLNRHLKWHDEHMHKIEAFLSSLKDDNEEEPEKDDQLDEPQLKRRKLTEMYESDSNDEDEDEENQEDLDDLIDLELRLLTAGDKSC